MMSDEDRYCDTPEGSSRYNLDGPSSGLRFIYALGRQRMCSNCILKDKCRYGRPCLKRKKQDKGHDFSGECGDYECKFCSLYFAFSAVGKG